MKIATVSVENGGHANVIFDKNTQGFIVQFFNHRNEHMDASDVSFLEPFAAIGYACSGGDEDFDVTFYGSKFNFRVEEGGYKIA